MFKIVKQISQEQIDEILSIVQSVPLQEDISSYAKGRQRTWLNMGWDLKNKKFDGKECFLNRKLWVIMQDIWPEADIGLLTYSGKDAPKGISLHRDDSYADYESYGIQLTGTCKFSYMGGYRKFCWEQDRDEEVEKIFILNPGDVFQFNCKNRHSAVPSLDRYAINLWKVSKKFKEEYDLEMRSRNISLF